MAIGKAGWRVALTALLLSVLLAIWVGFRFGSNLAREIALRELARVVPANVRVGRLDVSAVPPRLTANDFEIWDRGTRLVAASSVRFDLAVLVSLWQGAWIGDVELESPSLVYRENDPFWKKLGAIESRPGGIEDLPFLPRSLSVRSGSMTIEFVSLGLRAAVDGLVLNAAIGGLVRTRVQFDSSAKLLLERAGRQLELRRVAARGTVASGDVAVHAGVVDGESQSLRWSGRLRGGSFAGKLDWRGALDPIFALIPEAPTVRGAGVVRATIDGPLDRVVVASELEARSVRIDDVEFSGTGRLASRGREWVLGPARAEIFGGIAEGSANGRWDSRVPYELSARFRGWDPVAFIQLFGPTVPLRGTWEGEGHLAGDLLGDDLRGGGRFALVHASETLPGDASFVVSKQDVEVNGVIGTGAEDRLRCRYQVMRDSSPAKIAGEVEGKIQHLGLFAAFVNLRLEGRGTARAEFGGTVDEPLFRGAADLADLAVEGVPFGAVRGPFEISSAGLRSQGIVIQDGELEAKGRIALTESQENDWSAVARQASVAGALGASRMIWPRAPEGSGQLDGEVTVTGRWRDPRVDARARVARASLGAERLGAVSAEVTRAEGRWAVRASLRREDEARADVQASWAADGILRGEGTAAGWRFENLETVSRRWPALRGAVSFRGSLAGSTARPLGEGELEISELALARQRWGDLTVRVRLEGERALIEATAEQIRVSATAAISPPHAFRLRADWRDLDLGPLLVPETQLELRSAGTGELDGDADMPLARGSARVTDLRVGHGAGVLSAATPVALHIERGAIEVSEAVLEGSGQRLQFGARLTAAESEFHTVGTGDLALLESISPSVASARGRVDLELRGRRGSAEAWRYHGKLDLSGGALDLAFLVGVTDIAGHADFEGRELSLRELTGKIGGGDFLVAGSLELDRGWDLGWALHQGSFGVPSWLDYRASGNGRLTGLAFTPRLSGEIEVTQALYDRRIEWVEFLPWFRRQARPLRTPGGIPVALDLHVFADDGVFIDNNLVQAEMRGDLKLRSHEESLAWNGTIEVLGGEFVFRRRRFEITGGNVRFHEDRPMNPDLDFDGETSVTTREDEYEITVHVAGTAENPRVVFTADDPSLTENDVLALVTFGRTVAELEGQGGGIDVGEVLAITGPEGGRVQEQIQRLLRIDRIEIEPAYSRVSGVSEPRLRIAKDVTDRFSAIIGAGLGSERQQDVAVEYQLTRGLSLQGFWESQTRSTEGTFGGSLKFRVPFRSFTLLPDSFQRLAEP